MRSILRPTVVTLALVFGAVLCAFNALAQEVPANAPPQIKRIDAKRKAFMEQLQKRISNGSLPEGIQAKGERLKTLMEAGRIDEGEEVLDEMLAMVDLDPADFQGGADPSAVEPGYVSLFDGKTLNGWNGDLTYWSVRDGVIIGKHGGIAHNQFLCTDAEYKDFELRFDVRLIDGKGNSGVQVRSKRVPGSTEVSGYQVDIGDLIHWGALYDESRRNVVLQAPDLKLLAAGNAKLKEQYGIEIPLLKKIESPQRELFLDRLDERGWNSCSIRAVGDNILVKFNDAISVDYHEDDSKYSHGGTVGLQVHSGPPMEVRFRNIRIKDLGQGG